MHKRGIVVGKFDPLHRGHVDMIQWASGKANEIIVVISHSDTVSKELFEGSKLTRYLTKEDKLKIVAKTFQHQPNIHPVIVDETDCPTYPDGWVSWSSLVKDAVENIRGLPKVPWEETVFFGSETNDVAGYLKYFGCKDVVLYDTERRTSTVSATAIRKDPHKYWEYLPRASSELLTPVVEIVGGESSGKTFIVDKLGNYYGTPTVWERGRNWASDELGGDEGALQSYDYDGIAISHHEDIRFAKRNGRRFVITDTKYVSTQAFSITYEHEERDIVEHFIINDPSELVIMLDNSTKWVDDGMRKVGETSARENFQNLLKDLYKRYDIEYVEIKSSDYADRYELCKLVIDGYMQHYMTVPELQELVNKREAELSAQKENK